MNILPKIIIVIIINVILLFPQSFQGTELLIDAYEDSSTELLNKFFDSWENNIKPISDNEYNQLSDTLKEIYDLFYELYYPEKLICPFDFETEYYVLQNEILVFIISNSVEDTLFYKTGHNKKELIENNVRYSFQIKPRIKLHDKKILFLTKEYETYLNDFLYYDTDEIMNLPKGKDKYSKIIAIQNSRMDFLKPKVHCIPHHTRPAFYYYSYPYVVCIYLKEDLQIAQISYHVDSNMYRRKVYKKINNKWTMVLYDG